MRHQDVKPEMRVLYSPVRGGPEFAGTVRLEPWQLGGGTWVTHLKDMDPAYGRYVGRPGKTWVNSAAVDCLRPADVTEPHLLPTPGAPSAPVVVVLDLRVEEAQALRAILEDRADGGMMVPPENTILESLSEKLNRLRPENEIDAAADFVLHGPGGE